jgi:hypothetical protein
MSGDDAFPHLNHDTPKAAASCPISSRLRRPKVRRKQMHDQSYLTLSLYSQYPSSNQPPTTRHPAKTKRKPLPPSHFQDPGRPTTRHHKNARTKPLNLFFITAISAPKSITSLPPTSEHQAKLPKKPAPTPFRGTLILQGGRSQR